MYRRRLALEFVLEKILHTRETMSTNGGEDKPVALEETLKELKNDLTEGGLRRFVRDWTIHWSRGGELQRTSASFLGRCFRYRDHDRCTSRPKTKD